MQSQMLTSCLESSKIKNKKWSSFDLEIKFDVYNQILCLELIKHGIVFLLKRLLNKGKWSV